LLNIRQALRPLPPGTVKANIVVDIPRPQNEDDPRVLALKKELRSLIAGRT